jgi:hypothetical protein
VRVDRRSLERAYLATYYVVFAGSAPIILRIGERNREFDRLLRRHGRREWAFITSWNPRSRLLPGWRNAQRQRRLARLFPHALTGAGIGESCDWPAEDSLCVLGLAAGRARRTARLFGQYAVVAGTRGRMARLIWCDAEAVGGLIP